MKTKTKILSASLKLFNEKGYSNVTIRMVAQALNMSSGNLNYHFKKREDILEALYFEMVAEFDDRLENLVLNEMSLGVVKEKIRKRLIRMVRYRFFWTDLYNLLKLNSKIKIHFQGVYFKRYQGAEQLFDFLIKSEIMNEFKFDREKTFLIERMISFGNTWLYNSALYDKAIDNDYLELQANNMLAMLYPYLSNWGKQSYNKL
mgnify:CR=1 FL=1